MKKYLVFIFVFLISIAYAGSNYQVNPYTGKVEYFPDTPTFSSATIGSSTGISLSGASGVKTEGGCGNTNNEAWTIDFETVENQITQDMSGTDVNYFRLWGKSSSTYVTGIGIDYDAYDDGVVLHGYTSKDSTNKIYVQALTALTSIVMSSDYPIWFGSNAKSIMQWETSAGNDFLFIGSDLGQTYATGYLLYGERSDRDSIAPAAGWPAGATPSNPVFGVLSATQTTVGTGIYLWHNASNGIIQSYTGNIILNNPYNYAADAGSTDAYAITLTGLTLSTGTMIYFYANTANTGACSLNVNGGGAVNIKSLHDQDPADNYIEAGSIVQVIYDGTNFQLLTPDCNP